MITSPSRSPLKIGILGPGKIGSTFAFQLARVGKHDVTVIARPGSERFRQLQRDGGVIDVNGDHADMVAVDTLDEDVPYDLLIVTLLDRQTQDMLPKLQRSKARSIQFMFNTFHPERLQEAVGTSRCAFGMPFVQATLDVDGKLKATIGAGGQKTIMSEQHWVDVFDAAGLPAALEPDMPLWLRCHVPMCIAMESVAVAGMRRGGGASWGEAMTLARGAHEGFKLVKGLGFTIYPNAKKLIDASPIPVFAATLWSMSRIASFREVLSTGKSECRTLVDVLVAAAPLSNKPIDVPRIEAMRPE